MKSVLISIQPYWVFLIIAKAMGWDIPQEKTIEVRKDYPKDKLWNKVVHIYCSKNRKSFNRIPKQYQPFMKRLLGKVIGEFVCDKIDNINGEILSYCCIGREVAKLSLDEEFSKGTCISYNEAYEYFNKDYNRLSCLNGYGWHISDLKIYDTPKELGEFRNIKGEPIKRPFQSWGYVEEL